MKTVAQLLDEKGRVVHSVEPDATVVAALAIMADHNVGALLVIDDDRMIGIISERDYARKVVLAGRRSHEAMVRELMTARVSVVSPEHSVEECMALMTEQHIRHLPVMADDRIEGVISIGDVVKAVISHQEFMIQQLERYITSG